MPVEDPRAEGPDPREGFRVPLLLALTLGLLFLPVLLHPLDVLYSPWSDALALQYPFVALLSEGIRSQGFPSLWNPYSFCGLPTLGDPQSWVLNPPAWLFALLPPEETPRLFGLYVFGHLVLGALGMDWWLRGRGLGAPDRFAGAMTFALAGKWVAHLLVAHHLVYLSMVALPWQLGLIDRTWRDPSARRAATLALVTALWALGGHPQLLLYGGCLLAGYGAFRGAVGPRQGVAAPLGALVLAALLAGAIFAAPLAVAVDLTPDVVRGTGLGLEQSRLGAPPLWVLLVRLVRREAVDYFPAWEGVMHAGVAALALVPLALVNRRRRAECAFWTAAALAMIAYSAGTPVFDFAFQHLPGFDRVRIPTRAMLLFGLPLGFGAAAGIEELRRGGALSRRDWIAAGFFAPLGLGLFALFPDGPGLDTLLALAFPLLGLALARRFGTKAAAWVVALAVAADLLAFAAPFVQTRPLATVLGVHPAMGDLAAPRGSFRVVGVGPDEGTLQATYAVPSRVEMANGFNPLLPWSAYRYLVAGLFGEEAEVTDRCDLGPRSIADPRYLGPLGLRYVLSREPLDTPGLELRRVYGAFEMYNFGLGGQVYVPRLYLYEYPGAMPRAWVAPRSRTVEGPDEALRTLAEVDPREEVVLEAAPPPFPAGPGAAYREVRVHYRGAGFSASVDLEAPGFLVVGEPWFRGWRALVDGRDAAVLRAGGALCAVPLQAGDHEVQFTWSPRVWEWSRRVSLAGLVLTLGLLALPPGRKRAAAGAG